MAAMGLPESDPGGARPGGPLRDRIMVVDDEPHIIRLIQVNLERQGLEIITALDGREALEKVDTERPDLIVLDTMMPYLDGFEVLENLKKDPKTRDIPVIMLTMKAQDAEVFKGWGGSGVEGWLTKPFAPSELIEFIRRLLR